MTTMHAKVASVAQPSSREQLLAGAIACLQTKGYARTTARDIAAASGANLASIGYHFGSKEGLLNAAIIRTFEEWTQRLGEAAFAAPDAQPLERMARSWVAMLESFEEQRPLLVAFVEAMAQAERSEELRAQMAAHLRDVRGTVAEMVRASLGDAAGDAGVDPDVVASFLMAVSDGFVLQWLLSPEETPTGEQLIVALGSSLSLALRDVGDLSADSERVARGEQPRRGERPRRG
jgi:AcrR family transcriptional regulator